MTDLSIIVCTRNRASALGACLGALSVAIDAAPHVATEVVIIDNGSSDNTSDIVRAWASSASFDVQLHRLDEPGLALARNAALRQAKGSIFALTDDDCCVAADYVARIKSSFGSDAAPVVRGGRILLGDARDLAVTVKEAAAPDRYSTDIRPGGFIMGANLMFERTVWERVGGFDTRFGAGTKFNSAEDTDFVFRAHLAGFQILYDPKIVVTHFHGRRTLSDAVKLYRGYAFGDGAFYAKHFFNHRDSMRWMKDLTLEAANEALGRRDFGQIVPKFAQRRLLHNLHGMVAYWLKPVKTGSQIYR